MNHDASGSESAHGRRLRDPFAPFRGLHPTDFTPPPLPSPIFRFAVLRVHCGCRFLLQPASAAHCFDEGHPACFRPTAGLVESPAVSIAIAIRTISRYLQSFRFATTSLSPVSSILSWHIPSARDAAATPSSGALLPHLLPYLSHLLFRTLLV